MKLRYVKMIMYFELDYDVFVFVKGFQARFKQFEGHRGVRLQLG